MPEYHVGCGITAIYAGRLNKAKTTWLDKTSCTDEAICAVRDWMVMELLGTEDCLNATTSGYVWTLGDGREVELRISIRGGKK